MSEVKITQQEYNKMLRQVEKLEALEKGGVDNWEWYDESLAEWFAENEVEEALDAFVEGVNDILVDAEVDEPAGRGCGYYISLDETRLKVNALSLCKQYLQIQNNK